MAQYDIVGIVDPKEITNIKNLRTEIIGTAEDLRKFLKVQDDLKKQMDETNKSSNGATEKAGEYAAILNKAAESHNKLTAAAKELDSQQRQLSATEAKLATANTQTSKTLADKKRALQEANEVTKLNSIINDKNSGTLQRAKAENRLLQIQKEKLINTDVNYAEQLEKINKKQDENNQLMSDSANKLQKQKIGIGDYKQAFTGLFNSFKNGEIGLKGLTKGVFQLGKAFFVAIFSNPILLVLGAIVGAIYALGKAFLSTDSGADLLAEKMQQLKAMFDVVRQVAAGLSKSIIALFSGDSKKAAEEYANATKDVSERLKEAAQSGKEYAQTIDNIEDSQTNYISRAADLRNEIAKLDFESQNKSLSPEQRKEALSKLLALEQEDSENRKKLAIDKFNAEAKYLADLSGLKQEEIVTIIRASDAERENLQGAAKEAFDVNRSKFDSLEETYAKMVDADSVYFEENKRRYSKMTGFEEEINKDREATAKEKADRDKEILQAQIQFAESQRQLEFDNEMMIIEATSKTKEEAEMRGFELKKQYLEKTFDLLQLELDAFKGSEAEKLAIQEKLNKARFDLRKNSSEQDKIITETDLKRKEDASFGEVGLETNAITSIAEKKRVQAEIDQEAELERKAKKDEIIQAGTDSAIQIQGALFDFMDAKYSGDLERLEQKNAAGLLSEKEYATQKAEIEIKQAKASRMRAIFEATIGTAQAVISALQTKPFLPLGLIMAATAGIAGGLQIASILSTPLPVVPAFATGTLSAPSAFVAGEKGRELMQLKSGEKMMVDKATYFSGEKYKGARIMSNQQTEWFMNRTDHSGFEHVGNSDQLLTEIKGMRSDMKNVKIPIMANGRMVGYKQNQTTVKILNRYNGLN